MKKKQGQRGDTRVYTTLAILIGLLAGLVAIWLWPGADKGKDQPLSVELPAPEVNSVAEGVVQKTPPSDTNFDDVEVSAPNDESPVDSAPEVVEEPLPTLQESDGPVLQAAGELDEFQSLASILIPDKVLLKGVRAVIALADGNVVKDHRPIQSPAPQFKVLAIDETLDPDIGQRYTIDPANYERYTRYVNTVGRLDNQKLIAAYKRFYPLLKEAYGQYGLNQGSFHSVLIKAIDEVLSARIPPADAALVSPNVFYRFEDKNYESMSASGKLLWRMGPENTAALRSHLTALRTELNILSFQ